MKILFTCVGRRVELVQAFHQAAQRLGIPLTIFGTDLDMTAPALSFCTHAIQVPKISDKNYIPELQRICVENAIDLLIPTIDTDLLLLSKYRFEFGSTRVLISDPDRIAVCRDKRYTAEYFHSIGLYSPSPVDSVDKYSEGFPAFIKPKDGSSSISAYKANDAEQLKALAARIPDYIIQPFIQGTEYTVDIFCDFEGNPLLITPRVRVAVRAGEVLKTRIEQDKQIISEMKMLIADYKPCGPITVQMIRQDHTGKDYYIEINPRFGGGAPLSIKAGADSAEMLLRLLQGEKLVYMDKAAEDRAVFSRFDQSIRII